jgi:hypothetical protein
LRGIHLDHAPRSLTTTVAASRHDIEIIEE